MNKFVTFTTQNEHGSWLLKQGVKIEDIKKVVSVPDEYNRDEYDHSMLIFNDGSKLNVFENFDEVMHILNS